MIIDAATGYLLSQNLMGASFLVAAVACARARRWGVALFYLAAVADTYSRLRYDLKVKALAYLRDMDFLGADKETVQLFAFVGSLLMSVLLAAGLTHLLRRGRAGAFLIYFGALGVGTVFGAEMISLHDVDIFIYSSDLFLMRSAWLYSVFALCSVVGVGLEKRAMAVRRRISQRAARTHPPAS